MKDKKLLMVGTAMVTLSGLVAASRAQGAGTVTGTIGMDAVIVQALTLTNTVNLDFGTLIPGAAPGTYRIQPNGTPTATGVTELTAGSAGSIQVNGEEGFGIDVAAIANDSVTGPGPAMAVNTIEMAFNGGLTAASLSNQILPTVGTVGQATITFGGTLQVGANQTGGTYAGSFQAVIDYN